MEINGAIASSKLRFPLYDRRRYALFGQQASYGQAAGPSSNYQDVEFTLHDVFPF
jgi:hypothetical protein